MDNLRHSCAHLLAAAVMELWPETKRTIGPAIENGFYYDFDFGAVKISEENFPKIEAKMHELVKSWNEFEKSEVTQKVAKEAYKGNEYKLELIEEFSKEEQKLTFYKSGNYSDLCRGGHIEKPSEELKHFKLLSIAGAYWRGSEKNKMLTRIYGTVFPTQKELDEYLKIREEAEKRNHKKIGRELGLFMFHETAPGMAYWLPKGVKLYLELVNFWRKEHEKYNYQEIVSPLINKKELYETSGHWDHYKENMFISETEEKEVYALKPMNCPNAMVVFGSDTRSYRDLPLKLSDTDTLHRYEKSGTLNGLLRIREFRQDDAHIFISEDQIEEQYKELFEIVERFYSVFGLKYSYRLGTIPEKYMGDKKVWDKAENVLKGILEKSGKEFTVLEGDGAFYGPKIDILMKDSLGRDWQMGTLQLDFQIPARFGLKYSAQDGTQKTPVVIHRVVYGSLERFIGIIIEHFGGNFPTWLTPIQVKILPIAERHMPYALSVTQELKNKNIRVELDERSETLGNKIRNAQNEKVPYMLVLGDKEIENNEVSIRNRAGENSTMQLSKFTENIKKEIEKKKLN
ncbi:MAG: Threonine-tRNA ligase [Candidatus Woesebacteria bacterium GW2011_GWA2_40_7b]|uniref:Threonine--tRNA ligase n=1 Tax=Candidatus Woesebacteria bacterium GW2011_GWA2_40_7b TaxID=1618563 RepID=A0A0G0SYX8_9BACT|nr:MAG: Threonine-tRNA ligase [Candidatus Woesebacteria bacterium GW2011_GWA2_40_7b]